MKTVNNFGITAIANSPLCIIKVRMKKDTYIVFNNLIKDIETVSRQVFMSEDAMVTTTIVALESISWIILAASKQASNTIKLVIAREEYAKSQARLQDLQKEQHEAYVRSLKQAGPTLKRTVSHKETPLQRAGRLLSSFSSFVKSPSI